MAHWSSISLPTSVDRITGTLASAFWAPYVTPVETIESRTKQNRCLNSRMLPPGVVTFDFLSRSGWTKSRAIIWALNLVYNPAGGDQRGHLGLRSWIGFLA